MLGASMGVAGTIREKFSAPSQLGAEAFFKLGVSIVLMEHRRHLVGRVQKFFRAITPIVNSGQLRFS
jgi:hypothetical protein